MIQERRKNAVTPWRVRVHVERRYKGERKSEVDFFWRTGGISLGFERIFFRLLFEGNQSTF